MCVPHRPRFPPLSRPPQDKVQQLEAELSSTKEALATAQREREAAMAAESAALERQAAAAAAQEDAEARCLAHAEERERAEQEAAKARVDAQRCGPECTLVCRFALDRDRGFDRAVQPGLSAMVAWQQCMHGNRRQMCLLVLLPRGMLSSSSAYRQRCMSSPTHHLSTRPATATPQQDGRRQPQVCRA